MLTLENTFLDELLGRRAVLEFRVECVLGEEPQSSIRGNRGSVNIPGAGFVRVPYVQLEAQARHRNLEEVRPSVAMLPLSRKILSEKVRTRQDIVVDKLLLVGTLSKFLLQSGTSRLLSGGLSVRHDRQ